MLISGWDLVISRDGMASLWLYCEQPGSQTPRAVPVGPLPAADGRRLADWLCRNGPADSEDVRRRVQRTDAARGGAVTQPHQDERASSPADLAIG